MKNRSSFCQFSKHTWKTCFLKYCCVIYGQPLFHECLISNLWIPHFVNRLFLCQTFCVYFTLVLLISVSKLWIISLGANLGNTMGFGLDLHTLRHASWAMVEHHHQMVLMIERGKREDSHVSHKGSEFCIFSPVVVAQDWSFALMLCLVVIVCWGSLSKPSLWISK